MKKEIVKAVIATLGLVAGSMVADATEQYTVCGAECVAVTGSQLADLGPVQTVSGLGEYDAYQRMLEDCRTLVYNLDPCSRSSAQATLATSMEYWRKVDSGWQRSDWSEWNRRGYWHPYGSYTQSSSSSGYWNLDTGFVIHYASPADPQVCKSKESSTLPVLNRPVSVPRPYCGRGTPLG